MENYISDILMTPLKHKNRVKDNDEKEEEMALYNKDRHKKTTNVVSYESGFGQTSSHLVIPEMLFEVYDVFTGIAYLIQLYHNKYFIAFDILQTLIVNCILLGSFFQNSFQSVKFRT